MSREEFNAIFTEAVNKFREVAPKDNGHLAFNAVKGVWVSENHYKIYVDRDVLENQPNIKGKVAHHYYAQTINDNPKYRTYGWVTEATMKVAEFITNRIQGVMK